MNERIYACIDLKSFFASVECVERGLDPLTTKLAVADPSRGSGAICLAITPALKALGIPNRCRLYQIPDNIEHIVAIPRMKHYMRCSADIYSVYLKYISPEDINVYSIDECFLDFTPYLKTYGKTPKEMAVMLMDAVYAQTGVSATAGIGTNLFLAKVALDVTAKYAKDNIGYLDEEEFKRTIWYHQPITDIWNVGRGIAKRLEKYGIFDLYGVAHFDEQQLYKEFGVNAEFLIDHAHGIEPCTIKEIHEYESQSTSISNGQILFEDYNYEDALLVVREMVDQLVLEMIEKNVSTDSISLNVGYSEHATKSSGGTRKLNNRTNSYHKLAGEFERFYHDTTKRGYSIRRLNIGLNHILDDDYAQLDLFSDPEADAREKKVQETVLTIKNKFGKNAIMRGISLQEKATAQQRNKLVGGHNGE